MGTGADGTVNLTAGFDIGVTLGLPENKSTELKVTSTTASPQRNVEITANTPLNNLDISANKNTKIVGLYDISGKITAQDLNVTTPGNINVTAQLSGNLTAQVF